MTLLALFLSIPVYAESAHPPQACTQKESKKLEAEVRQIAGVHRNPDQAWQLIHMLLCDPTTPANVSLALRITVSSYQTGDEKEKVKRELRSREGALSMFRQGAAWDAKIQKEEEGIVISYASDEACVEGCTLRYGGKTWQVVKFDGACD